jgi:hypothetical protein
LGFGADKPAIKARPEPHATQKNAFASIPFSRDVLPLDP